MSAMADLQLFQCEPMRARISERQCFLNQFKARRVEAGIAQANDPNGYEYGDCFRAYCACKTCKRANPPIKHRPITVHTDLLADAPSPEQV